MTSKEKWKFMILIIGAFLGLFLSGLGHMQSTAQPSFLRKSLDTHTKIYNQVNAVVIVAIGLILPLSFDKRTPVFKWCSRIFVIDLFIFSIYFSILLGIKEITYITPVGNRLNGGMGLLSFSAYR